MFRLAVVLVGVLLWSGTAWSADGEAVYQKKCKSCHSIGGVGGPMAKLGGPLDGVGSKHDEEWLRAYLKDPKSQLDNAKMPRLKLSDEDLDAVVAYLLTLTQPG